MKAIDDLATFVKDNEAGVVEGMKDFEEMFLHGQIARFSIYFSACHAKHETAKSKYKYQDFCSDIAKDMRVLSKFFEKHGGIKGYMPNSLLVRTNKLCMDAK